MSGWSPEKVEQLKELWEEGYSASQVARLLGGGHTRNSVIGKVHRLGLAGRNQQPQRTAAARPVRLRPLPAPPAEPVKEPDAVTLESGAHYTIATIRDGLCKWPIGDPKHADFHFCANPCPRMQVYCDVHQQRAWAQGPSRPHRHDGKDELAEIARNERAIERLTG